ncbi:class I SAM-dependent methyltransferase [Fischerella sp. JS2]|uniref:class I SAM-dependent methyltransferase n=1 Tax=Fischerella sp. JS2 TaxID=2597771 RepID=UPI0028EE4360|nr:class I SAM-dependent methyltransferase [Fischerella sp. JS2]
MQVKTDPSNIKGDSLAANSKDFSNKIAFNDHKIRFIVKYSQGKDVLDIGCVCHNPESYKSKYWVHKAIKEVARSLIGIDLYQDGVEYLQKLGFNVVTADAQCFELGKKFDVIVAGDIIEHLEDFHGFLKSCKKHMHKDSRLLISTPNPWYWRNIIKAALNKEVNNNPEHTCWLCVRTLRQLVNRHGMNIGEIQFGSTYLRDKIIPLPRGWKHTSFHAEVFIMD